MFGKEVTKQEMERLLSAQEELRQYNEERDRLINAMQFYCEDPRNMTEAEYLRFISPYETMGSHKEIKRAAKRLSKWYKKTTTPPNMKNKS